VELPAVGTRVVVRYRLPAGSVPPLTDVIGRLVESGPTLRVHTKRGDVVTIAVDDVVAIKALSAAPVRTADIRNLEHAAALAWPGVEQEWLDGWLLRFGHGSTRRANSAVPLNISTTLETSAIVDWYTARGVPALMAAPDRLLPVPPRTPTDAENLVMVRDLDPAESSPSPSPSVSLASRPDDEWMRLYRRPVPVDVLTAVLSGELTFATIPGAAVGRAAITVAPDGTRWLGLSALKVSEDHRRRGHARNLCTSLLDWGARRGATRAYTQVEIDNASATTLFESMGFIEHHRSRYVRADAL
jgi:GNAT superfamily N-acetyltransferase